MKHCVTISTADDSASPRGFGFFIDQIVVILVLIIILGPVAAMTSVTFKVI